MPSSEVTGKELSQGRAGTCKGVWNGHQAPARAVTELLSTQCVGPVVSTRWPRPWRVQELSPKHKEGGTGPVWMRPLFLQHWPQGSCLTAPQGTLDTHSSCSLSASFVFKSMKELTFLACNSFDRAWNLYFLLPGNMWEFSYALRVGFMCKT